MGYLAYKLVHLLGVILVFLALGGLLARQLASSAEESSRKLAGMTHGIGLLLILVAGFGLIARLGTGFPLWIWLKLGIWVLFGGVTVLINRAPQQARLLWLMLPLLGLAAAYLGIYKPVF